ncbi:Bcr/CflA family efflux MFS transporter [Azospirillum sp. INR13]|uniref:Bcr/CflA family efflux MFS transporter n=1 Tax=Azospirillum sp. INR13 TaxID=2596919 RepID=UPI00351C4CA1
MIYLAASAVCAMTTSIEGLIAARFFQALGACCGPVVARAVVRDVFGRDRAATVLAYMSMAMALAPAVGPMLGGVLTEWFGWRANFVLLTVFACGILAAVWSMLDETNAHRDEEALRPGRLAANYLLLLRNRGFVGYVLVVAFSYSGIFSFISGSSFVLIDRLHLTPAQYGASFGAVALGYMLGTFLAGRLTPRLGGARMIRIGTLLSLGGGVVGGLLSLAGVLHLLAIVGPVFLFILGAGLTLPNATANAVGPYATMAGLASSLLGFAQMTIAAAIGIVVGHMSDGSALPMMGAIGLVALGALLAHRLLVIPSALGGRSA